MFKSMGIYEIRVIKVRNRGEWELGVLPWGYILEGVELLLSRPWSVGRG